MKTPSLRSKINLKESISNFRSLLLAIQNTMGIDVGHSYIKIAQFQRTRKGFLLTDYRVRAIPFKVRDNLRERNNFIKEFINEYLSQTRIKTSLGRIIVEGSGVFTFSFLLPALSEKDLKGAIEIELKKKLPFQVDFKNIYLDYFVTDRLEDEKGTQLFVTCIAVDKSLIERNLDFLKSFNLRPVMMSTTADALGNLIRIMQIKGYVGVLEIGARKSFLNFYHDGLLQFSREIPIGGDQFTQGVLKVLKILFPQASFDDAEMFKKQCGIPLGEEVGSEFYTDLGAVKGEKIVTGLRSVLERLITEISRTITFYFRTYKIDKLESFYLTGGGSRIKNLDRFLSANLKNLSIGSIERLNPLKAIRGWLDVGILRQELVMEEAAPHLSSIFGLCMDKGGQINLVPPKEKIEQKALFVLFLAKLIFPALLIFTLVYYGFNYTRRLVYSAILERTYRQITQMKPKIKEIEKYFELRNQFKKREDLLTKAIGRQPLWWGILKELSNIIPEEVTLNKLEIDTKNPKEMCLEGEVISEYTNLDLVISQFTLNLNDSPYFSNVRLVSSERVMFSAIPKARFEIVCDLVY